MAENNVDVVATIRIRNQALAADAAQAKKEFKDVKAEAEKPTQIAVSTDKAVAEVKELDKAVEDLHRRMATLNNKLDTAGGRTPGVDFSAARNRLAAAQSQLDALRQPMGGGSAAAAGAGLVPERGLVNGFRDGMGAALKTVVAIDATISSIEAGIAGANLVAALFSGNMDDAAAAGKEMDLAIRGIPIVGNKIADLGAKIHEAFTGTAREAARITLDAQLASRAIDAQRAAVGLVNEALKEQQEIIDGIIRRREMLGMRGQVREEAQAAQQAADERKRIEEKAAADIKAVREKNADALTALMRRVAEADRAANEAGELRTSGGGMDAEGDAIANAAIERHNQTVREARRIQEQANAELLAGQRLLNDQVAAINAKKNEALLESEKTTEKTREQIAADALKKRTDKERDAVKRMADYEIAEAERVAKAKEAADAKRQKDADDLERRSSKEREAVRRMNAEVEKMAEKEAQAAERAAKAREERDRRNTRLTTTTDLMSGLMLEGISGGVSDGRGVQTVTDRIRANLQDFHSNRGGTQGTSDDTPKKQLSVMEKIAANTDPNNPNRNTAEVILD